MVFTAPLGDRQAAGCLGLNQLAPMGVPFFLGHGFAPSCQYVHYGREYNPDENILKDDLVRRLQTFGVINSHRVSLFFEVNVTAFLFSVGFVVLAEMGDKTQLLAMAFATRYKAPLVMWGVFAATVCNHLLAVLAGNCESAGHLDPPSASKSDPSKIVSFMIEIGSFGTSDLGQTWMPILPVSGANLDADSHDLWWKLQLSGRLSALGRLPGG